MPLDLRNSTATIVREFSQPTSYAMQCPAPDPRSEDFYIAQADKAHSPEDLLVTRNVPTSGIRMKAAGYMRLVGGGHGTTTSVLYRGDVLGIVTNAWGRLSWIPWVAEPVVKTDPSIEPIWPGWGYAYIDHEAQTVCLRKGNLWRLHALDGDKLGRKIGKDVTGITSTGPNQGYCSVKVGDDYQVFSVWDYGRVTSKPMIVAGSFTTGGRLYATTGRVLPKLTYAVTQEPEGCYGLGGVFYLGMSTRGRRGKIPMAVRLDAAEPPPPPPPVEPPAVVTMWVRPDDDPIWRNADHTILNRLSATKLGTAERESGDAISGSVVAAFGGNFLKESGSGLLYKMDYLTLDAPQ